MILTALFILSIFVAIWSSFICFGTLYMKQGLPAINIVMLAASVTAIITRTIGIW